MMLDGHPVAVTAGKDTPCVWDLTDGSCSGGISAGAVEDMAIVPFGNRPAVAVLGHDSRGVGLWDLAAGHHVSDLPAEATQAMALGMIDACPVVVTGHEDCTVRVWDLTTCRQIGPALVGHTTGVAHVATAMVDGRAVAITGGGMDLDHGWDEKIRIWDLTEGRQLTSFPTADGPVSAMAMTALGGRPVVMAGYWDGRLQLWDVTTGQGLRVWQAESLTDLLYRPAGVSALQAMVLRGRPVVLAGHDDGTLRIWDVATDKQTGPTLQLPTTEGASARRRSLGAERRRVRLAIGPQGGLVACADQEVALLCYGGTAQGL
ncbi:hypothetical protein [Streptomyces sp. NPDC048269]|uniref:WD40 repeat domain-containing protein n=1 Tax=Streptomyces sp. NPDC048269 TaxID=3155753 RepID=UPI003426D433